MEFLGHKEDAAKAYEDGLEFDPNNQQLLDGLKKVRRSFLSNLFPSEGFAKLAKDPRTKDLISDPQFMSLLLECQRNPQMLM